MGWTPGPTVIDLSHNLALEFVMMPRVLQLKTLILAEDNIISYLDVSGPNQLTQAEIDYILARVPNAITP